MLIFKRTAEDRVDALKCYAFSVRNSPVPCVVNNREGCFSRSRLLFFCTLCALTALATSRFMHRVSIRVHTGRRKDCNGSIRDEILTADLTKSAIMELIS